jgi:hypothetical protein
MPSAIISATAAAISSSRDRTMNRKKRLIRNFPGSDGQQIRAVHSRFARQRHA